MFVRHLVPELAGQPSLPNARITHDGDEPWAALFSRQAVRDEQLFELLVPPDEVSAESVDPARAHQRERSDEPPARHPPALALCLHHHGLGELECAAGRSDRALAHQDLSGAGSLLEAGSDVDGVACHERASFARAADHDVAGVHADPEDELLAEHRFELPAHGQRGMQGSLGMVLVCGGRAEGRHDRVSGKLLDRTSGSHDLLRHGLIEALEHGPGPLGILGSPELSGADEVGEEHRCNLALVDGPSLNDTGLLVNPCRQP